MYSTEFLHIKTSAKIKSAALRSFGLIALLALLCPIEAAAQNSPRSAPGFTVVWNKSVAPLLALSMSPQGGNVAMMMQGGRLALWSSDDATPIWSVKGIGGHDLVVSDQMGYVLVFDQMNRLDHSISLYRSRNVPAGSAIADPATPVRVARYQAPGAVWAATVSMDGSHAACGTGDKQVCLFTLDARPKMSAHPIDGICNDLQFANNNQYIAIGLWNQSGVETMDMAGRIRWSYLSSNDRRYSVSISPDSRKVLAVSYYNHQSSDPVLSLLDDQGAVKWTFPLGPDAYQPSIQLGLSEQVTYASYTQMTRRGPDVIPERSMVALGPLGDTLWIKGGLFFSPTLMCLSPDGSGAIAYDSDKKTLYRLDNQGRILARDKLSGQLEYWAASRDRKRLVVYTSDGQLSMLELQ